MTDIERKIKAKIPGEDTGITVKHSICDICSPGVSCGVNILVKDGAAIGIEGREDFIPNKGALCCKGAVGRQYMYRKDRILSPMKCVGKRGSGNFEKITWDEAFAITAEKLNESKSRYGAEATAFLCGYPKWFRTFFHRLAYSFGSPNYITESSTCYQAGVVASKCIFGSNAMPDFAASKLAIIWGHDPFNQNVHSGKALLDFRQSGGKIVVIDPRQNAAADRLADIYLRPRLGTDGYMANAMAAYIIDAGLYDKEFVDKYVYGFEEYRKMVSEYSLEEAGRITGIPAEDIRNLAEEFATTDPSTIISGNGFAHHTNGFNTKRAVLSLLVICGRFDRPGTMKPGSGPMSFCYSAGGFMSREPMFINSVKPRKVHEVGWEKYPLFVDQLNEGQGMELARQIMSGKPYPIRSAFLAGVNYLMYPETDSFRKAMESLDFIAASDIFWTESCMNADIVFPVCTSYERAELKFYANKFAYYSRPAVQPLGESKSDADIFFGLARALKLEDELMTSDYDTCARFMVQDASGFTDWDALMSADRQLPVPNARAYRWGTNLENGVRTPSGKLELYSQTIAAYERPELNPLPVWEPGMDTADAGEYDMVMSSGARNPGMIHSRLHDCAWTRALRPEASVDIHPEDAAARGIADGARVRISTPKGSIEVAAHITETTASRELQMFHGYKEANINQLLDSQMLDPYCGYPAYKEFRCKIEAVKAE